MSGTTSGDRRDPGAVIDAQAAAGRARLRRMQWLATSLLGAMLVLFLVSAAYQSTHSALHWVRAFAEAGAVGAMADWYAVVALFRHPLGLPIPHTAIIPKNKDRIGESLANFVEHNFLTPENIIRELERHNAARALAEWLAVPANSRGVAQAVCEAIPAILDALDDEDVRRFFDRTLTPHLGKLDVSRIAGNALQVLTEGGRHQALLDRRDPLGREPCIGAVVDRTECDAVVVERGDRVAEREDLEPPGVGEDRATPA